MAPRVYELTASVYGFDDTAALVADNFPEFGITGLGGVTLGGFEYVIDDADLYKLDGDTLAQLDDLPVDYAGGEEPATYQALAASEVTGFLYVLATSGGGPGGLEVLEVDAATGLIQRRLPLPVGSTTSGLNNTAVRAGADGTKLLIIAANSGHRVYEMVIATGVCTSLFTIASVDSQINAFYGNNDNVLSDATGIGESAVDGNIYLSGLNATVAVVNHGGTLQRTLITGQGAVGGSFYAMALDDDAERVWAVGQGGGGAYLIALGFADSVEATSEPPDSSSAPSVWMAGPEPEPEVVLRGRVGILGRGDYRTFLLGPTHAS